MSGLDDREKAFELKFANDEEIRFKVTAKRNLLVAEWVADLIEISEENRPEYVQSVIEADLEEAGNDDIIKKLMSDLDNAGNSDITRKDIEYQLDKFFGQAKEQYMNSSV